MGHRPDSYRDAKHVYNNEDVLQKSSYYILDAQGNVLSIYERAVNETEESVSYQQVEKHIYGASRLGILTEVVPVLASEYTSYSMDNIIHTIGNRNFELNNHLGNVLSVISDKAIPHDDGNGFVDYFLADIRQSTDYSPFGVTLENRNLKLLDPVSGNPVKRLRYGFNGMEKDDEVKGSGNSYSTEFRQYDPRLGRWLSIDPVTKEHRSPYDGFNNNPIIYVDPRGDDDYYNADGSYNREMSKKYNNNGTHNIYVLSVDKSGKTLLADMPIKTETQRYVVERVMSGYAKKAGVSGKVRLERLAKTNSTMAQTLSKTVGGKLVSKKVTVNTNGGINEDLSDYHNLISTLFHERLHQKDVEDGISTENDKTFNGLMVHVEVYKRQIEDKSTYERTSADFKAGNIGSYAKHLQDAANLLSDSFDEAGDKAKIQGMIDYFNANEGKEYGFHISFRFVSLDNTTGKSTYEVKSTPIKTN
ncbi:RHS repeat-associated core domain-containing protein [Fluviicola taffensis]|uniref:RHS repeat-associated core domain-containing protein n=1 Tax=Fluviicola taffensis TaxID=191579 RepID=UPI0031378EB3